MYNETEKTKQEIEEKKKESREFYKNNLCVLPASPNFRQFRLRLWDVDSKNKHKWIKLPQIKTAKKLQKWLIKLAPRDVYFSTSRFLNPSKVGPRKWNHKPGFKWAYNLFLGAELYFDFDDKDFKPVREVFNILTDHFHFKKIRCFETARGYHLWVEDFEDVNLRLKSIRNKSMSPWEREQKYLSEKTKIVNYISSKGLQFDMPITKDTRRIIRVPGSLQANGWVVEEVKI